MKNLWILTLCLLTWSCMEHYEIDYPQYAYQIPDTETVQVKELYTLADEFELKKGVQEFSPNYIFNCDAMNINAGDWLSYSFEIYAPVENPLNHTALLVFNHEDNSLSKKWEGWKVQEKLNYSREYKREEIKDWQRLSFYKQFDSLQQGDLIKSYFWNPGEQSAKIRNVQVALWKRQ